MRRDKFVSGENVGKHTDERSGMSLFPYKDRVPKAATIWKSRQPPIGMLMIKAPKYGFASDYEEEAIWKVCWRSSDGKEEMELELTVSDILERFDPVFSVL